MLVASKESHRDLRNHRAWLHKRQVMSLPAALNEHWLRTIGQLRTDAGP